MTLSAVICKVAAAVGCIKVKVLVKVAETFAVPQFAGELAALLSSKFQMYLAVLIAAQPPTGVCTTAGAEPARVFASLTMTSAMHEQVELQADPPSQPSVPFLIPSPQYGSVTLWQSVEHCLQEAPVVSLQYGKFLGSILFTPLSHCFNGLGNPSPQ
jgi:hypothetical protein